MPLFRALSELFINTILITRSQFLYTILLSLQIVPEIFDAPPDNLLELTYRTVRTFPGMKVSADLTRSNPIMKWPSTEGDYYTLILSNLDINNRKNRCSKCSINFRR